MEIKIPHDKFTPELQQLALQALLMRSDGERGRGYTSYNVSDSLVSQEQLDVLLAQPCTIDKLKLFIERPIEFLDEEVPEKFPNRTYVDVDEKEVVRTMGDYFKSQIKTHDEKKVIIQLVAFPHGATDAPNGLLDSELKLYVAEYTDTFGLQNYNTLLESDDYKTKI